MEQQSTKIFSISFIGTLLVSALAIAIEARLMADFVLGSRRLESAVVTHLVVVLLVTLWLVYCHWRKTELKHVIIVLILTTFTGIFGAIASLIMLLFYAIYSRQGSSFIDWIASLFPEERQNQSQTLYQRLSSGWDDFSDKKRIMTFTDAINLGTIQQKREALAKISRYYRRDFAPALREALHDENNSIRVQAATVVAKFEQEYLSRYMTLSRKYKADPTNMDLLLEFARQADSYAYSGFLDSDREGEYRLIATEAYEKYLESDPDNEMVRFALARLYIYRKEYENAYDSLRSYLDSPVKPPITNLMWLIESMYHLGKYDEIRLLLNEIGVDTMSDNSNVPLIIREIVSVWNNGLSEQQLTLAYDI